MCSALQNYNQLKMLKKLTKPLHCLKAHINGWNVKQQTAAKFKICMISVVVIFKMFNLLPINNFWCISKVLLAISFDIQQICNAKAICFIA